MKWVRNFAFATLTVVTFAVLYALDGLYRMGKGER